MLRFSACAFSLLSALLSIPPALPALVQHDGQSEQARTLTIAAKNKQDSFALRVSARDRTGLVEIRNDSGTLVETLACPLLRDASSPSDPEMKAVDEKFVTSFEVEDLDFDGYMDLMGPREFGAKWTRYCVWFYDPKSHTFSGSYGKRPLAEQMELLYNLHADPKRRRIISYSLGPVDPIWDEYRIQGLGHDRPYWPRLIPVQSCFIQTAFGKSAIAVATRYEGTHSIVTRQELRPEDKRPISELCGK